MDPLAAKFCRQPIQAGGTLRLKSIINGALTAEGGFGDDVPTFVEIVFPLALPAKFNFVAMPLVG